VVRFEELDDRVSFVQQLGEAVGPVVFMNVFHVAPEDVDDFVASWTVDGEFMKRQRVTCRHSCTGASVAA
jgi:hypothetical protein